MLSGPVLNSYCNYEDIYDRLLIIDSNYDSAIAFAAVEAARAIVDVMLAPYVDTIPLPSWDQAIRFICADFTASIFKRRMTPDEVRVRGTLQPDMINDIDGTGWFALGIRKLEQYIQNTYVLSNPSGSTGTQIGNILHNPDTYLRLYKQKIITGVEARDLMNDANGSVVAELKAIVIQRYETNQINNEVTNVEVDSIDKTENLQRTDSETKTLNQTVVDQKTLSKVESDSVTRTESQALSETLDKTDTVSVTKTGSETRQDYLTKKQNKFAFIKGNPDQYGIEQAGYEEGDSN